MIQAAIAEFVAKNVLHLVIYGAIAAVATGGFFGVRSHFIDIGYTRAMEAVAAQDQEAINAADQARGRVRACSNSGGVWRVTEGVCGR